MVKAYFIFFLAVSAFVDAATNPYWERAQPYLIPEDHPIKYELDALFLQSGKRVVQDKNTLKEARFVTIRKGKPKKPFVIAHSELKGYLLKVYVDKQKYKKAQEKLLQRVEGAEIVRELIDELGYQSLFKVPKKWIYPLVSGKDQVTFVLVVEDMDIHNQNENLIMWKGSEMTPEVLTAVITLLKEGGLSDSVYPFNIPFSRDGKIAVVDTEFVHVWPVGFRGFKRYLSKEMWKLCRRLI